MGKPLHLLGLASLLLLAACTPAPSARLSPDGPVARDLAFIAETLIAVHPTLAEPAAAGAFAARAREVVGAAAGAVGREDEYRLAQRLLVGLRDAHTQAYPVAERMLGLRFRWLSDGIVVAASAAGAGDVVVGDEVVSLGGTGTAALLERLRGMVPAENEHWLRERGAGLLAYRPVLAELGVLETDGTVLVGLRNTAGETRRARLPLLAASQWPREPDSRSSFGWRLEPLHDLAVFWLDSCDNSPEYREAVRAFFAAVRDSGITRVALDVRRNSGGDSSVIDAFLAQLPAEGVRVFHSEIRYSAQAVSSRAYPALHWLGKSIDDALTGGWRAVGHEDGGVFRGRLFVLTNGRTFSSANWIAVLLSDNRLATIVGEPTGNAPSSFGDILRFRTPAAGLDFTVSHKRFTRPDPARDPAVTLQPDVLVAETLADFRARRDPALEWLRRDQP